MIDKEDIKGIIVPIVTPVDENENLDEVRMRKIVNHVIDTGVHGILAFGSNSEFYMFEDDEMFRALDIIIEEADNRVPVYFGIGAIRTRKCIQLAQEAAKRNIAAVSILQPMFIQPTDQALYNHFESIAKSVPNTAVLLYNNPGRCGYGMSKYVVSDLAHNVSNIVGIKDSSGDITHTSEIIRLTAGTGFRVLTGKDTVIYAGLCMGAVGSVCSTANMFGELVNSIYDLYVDEKYEEALKAQYKLNPIRLSQDGASFPAAAKQMSNLVGLDVGEPIRPTEFTDGIILQNMKKAMHDGGFIESVD